MILRWLAREVRDFPATSFFCLSWIAVFAAMTYTHLASGAHLSPLRWLVIGFGGGEPFGDLTLNDLARGQVWRLMTCNFVHYSLLHIVMNLLAMYQLGSVLESWYGSHQLVFIYGLTGGGGNLLSAICRLWTGSNRAVHSAGGSVVIMGMLGLCAVAGWRIPVPGWEAPEPAGPRRHPADGGPGDDLPPIHRQLGACRRRGGGRRDRLRPSAALRQHLEALGVGRGRPDRAAHRRLRRGPVRGGSSRRTPLAWSSRWSAARTTWCMPRRSSLDCAGRSFHRSTSPPRPGGSRPSTRSSTAPPAPIYKACGRWSTPRWRARSPTLSMQSSTSVWPASWPSSAASTRRIGASSVTCGTDRDAPPIE